jgi:hypothetical protein
MLSGIAVAEPDGEVETIVMVVLSARPGYRTISGTTLVRESLGV